MWLRYTSYMFALSLLTSTLSWSNSEVTLHGTLINLTCKINNDEKIEIDFGKEVVAELLDGMKYKEPMMLPVKCNQDYNGDLSFTIIGEDAGFENTAVKTNISGLGIRFIDGRDSTKFLELNKPYTYNKPGNISLEVVPVKAKDAKFEGGDFQASVTLTMEPQ